MNASVHPEKMPQQSAGASWGNARGTDARGNDHLLSSPERQSTKFRSSLVRSVRDSAMGKNAKQSTSQKALHAEELRKETQAIVLQFPTAEAAEDQGTTIRAVENQKNGDSSISFLAVVNWCRRNPRARGEFMRLLGCGEESNPDFQQAFHLLMQAQVRTFACEDSPEVETEPMAQAAIGSLFPESRQ